MNDEQQAKHTAAIREHTQRIGEIAINWSYIHVVLAMWYGRLASAGANMAPAMQEWDEGASDYRDRKMLAAKLQEQRGFAPNEFDSMLWVLEWLNELAPIRNAYVHLCIVTRGLPDSPVIDFMDQLHGGQKDPFKRVREKPVEAYEAAMKDVDTLREFAHRTFNAVFVGGQFKPSPPRPQLTIQKVFADAAPRSFK